jgi:LCP family protein required for cell wall assembly
VAPDAINIVVLGSDQRPDWSEWHTDAVHLVSIQTDQAVVSVLSIPRDLYVYIPGISMSRVNFADYYGEVYGYSGGGPGLVRDTLLYNLGIRVDHYVRTNFDGLIGIVDTLGGVDIPVHCSLEDHWPYPDENGEYPLLTLEPGIHHMDGETALWYARSRMTTSVFSRERRQQQVLQAIWRKLRSEGQYSQIPTLWQQVQGMVATDMDLDDIVAVAGVAFLMQDQNVRFYRIDYDMVSPFTTARGGYVFLPNWEGIQPVVSEVLAAVPESRLTRTYMPVLVWNGTSSQDWDRLAADRLNRAGFPAVVGQPDHLDYTTTWIIVYSEYAKGTGLSYLQQMFDIPEERVIYRPRESSAYGFLLILGADYQPCYEPW